jgi:hypothetical protein
MLAAALTLLFWLDPTANDPAPNRQIAAPCSSIEEKATQYLEEHSFSAGTTTQGDEIVIDLRNFKDVLTPVGKPLSLNRFSIHKYTLARHLSPMKTYDGFQLEGQLRLAKTAEKSCNVSLHFDFSAYEWVWALAVIDDGYRSKFVSNGTLEQLYLDAIAYPFTKP